MTSISDEPLQAGLLARIGAPFRNWSVSRAQYPLGYLRGLDGARGMIVLAVLGAHTRPALLPGVAVFMDSFFALSGYLITSVLLKDYEAAGRIDFRKFYIRRFMRLFPALTAMLLALLAIAALFSSEFKMRLLDVAVAFFYVSDYWRAFGLPGLWYTSHTWSLSVEEQFYLLWPLTLLLCLRWAGISWRTLGAILALAFCFALWRAWLTYDGATIVRLYSSFDTRADALLFGGALAVAMKLVELPKHPRLSAVLGWALAPLAIADLAIALTVHDDMRWYYYIAPLLGAWPACLFTAALIQPYRNVMHTIFEHPLPVFCGRICYGLYVWHYPVFVFLRQNDAPYIVVLLIGWPICFSLATASYYFIERHAMKARPV